jgi:hypothetical protein
MAIATQQPEPRICIMQIFGGNF